MECNELVFLAELCKNFAEVVLALVLVKGGFLPPFPSRNPAIRILLVSSVAVLLVPADEALEWFRNMPIMFSGKSVIV